ncbi:DUF551 domain-containing protein [Enterobacter ludwigii]|uniref:DUF551 domain-containing protein n=1 Tax=Enterobacter ludwigii TaxID=299767 RepID=UPI00244C970E|nr:DUF551 domain-containing protein [Enterobacter ludwigii]WGG63934.1 DUF551 domain-containing protein [Enterobacter ludwigii]
MSNIDKHAVQAVADLKAGYTLGHADVAILNELARIALASLEAEPAIHRWRRVTFEPYGPYPWHYGNFIGFSKPVDGIEDEYYYAAPPAPVSVPAAMEMDDDFDSAFEHGKAVGWNAYRAAMLQSFGNSEQLNSPVIPDGWVACSERMPDNDDFVYIWPRPDFGVELHVAQYGKFDKRDAGWYAQVYEQNYGIEYYPIKVTHWMALPAAPQQEA